MKNAILILTLLGAASFTRALGATAPVTESHSNQRDLMITQLIHRDLAQDSELSTAGKNVKVITLEGEVILRGPVNSEMEANRILSDAKRIAGDAHVQDQLDIKTTQ